MRCHHQKTHMIGDLLIREQGSVFLGRATKFREEIRLLSCPAHLDLPTEEADDRLTTLYTLPHLRAGEGCTNNAGNRGHHMDEGPVELVCSRSELDTEEG